MTRPPVQPPAAELTHLLAVPSGATADAVARLAATRWPRAAWESGRLTLSRYSHVSGPVSLADDDAASLGLPLGLSGAYVVTTLRERGEPPFPGTSDPTGIARAFPGGLPIREEQRVVEWLVAAARRLGGAVRFAESGAVVAPPAGSAIDLTVYSDHWLKPRGLADALRGVGPTLRLAVDLADWDGPATAPRSARGAHAAASAPVELPDGVRISLTEAERASLHAEADAADIAVLRGPVVLDGYALTAELGEWGTVWIEVSRVAEPPGPLRYRAWPEVGAVAYALIWDAADPAHLLAEFPPPGHVAAREAMAPLLRRLAAALMETVGSAVLDADGFPLDPADLGPPRRRPSGRSGRGRS